MLCSVYYQSQVYSKHFCLTVRLEKIPWRLLVTTIYTWCTSIMHWSENIFCFVAWSENILQFSLTVRLKNMILGNCQCQELLTYSEKHLLFNIRLLWFWNHGMVHVCLYIYVFVYIAFYIIHFSPDHYSHCNSAFRSLTFSLVSAASMNDVPTIQGKRIIDCTRLHASIT